MNRPLTLESVRRLASQRAPPCISIYMPTHRRPGEAAQDRIRYKNLLGRVEERLQGAHSAADARAILAPLEALSTEEFWTHQLDGLAIFSDRAGAQGLDAYHLPTAVSELAVVADSFHLRPLLRHLQGSGRYFLLRLSQHQAQLLSGNENGIAPVTVPGLPGSLEEALGERFAESHLARPHPTSKSPSAEELLRYFRQVGAALWGELREQKEPLVLAAPKSYHTTYASVNRYPHLLPDGLQGNFERSSPDELHEQAWPRVQARMQERLAGVLATYERWVSAHRAVWDPPEVARCAVQGRVLDLLIAEGEQVWGRLDPTTGEIELGDGRRDHNEDDVLDDLAEAVLLRGGDVFAVARERMPNASPVAALLRW
jgi:hypothetical protein